jgi:uncharacterized protein (DUF1697 family)
MRTYISMLRGINVSGHNMMKMSDLQKAFEGLGFEQVKTYIQSGNVVFQAPKISPEEISKKMEDKINRDFGFLVPVISRTPEEFDGTIRNNPFLREKGVDSAKLHVTFLSEAPADACLKKLAALPAHPDQFRSVGREIYLYCPEGYGRTKLSNNAIEKVLTIRATTRNWRTVNKLYEMALLCG